jgi:hypothetical protein
MIAGGYPSRTRIRFVRRRPARPFPSRNGCQQRVTLEIANADALAVDPLRGVGVAADLEVVLELLAPDRPVLARELLNLAQDEGVALDRGRVVRLVDPDALPAPPPLPQG